MKGLLFQAEDFKVYGFDLRDAQVEHSLAYEFDIEVDNSLLQAFGGRQPLGVRRFAYLHGGGAGPTRWRRERIH